jgi:hypothetical protein
MSDLNRSSAWDSREMRLLVVTIVIAAGVLLVLARFRFPERPAVVDTSTQPLERLAARASFEDLANRVERFEQAIAPSLVVLRLTPREDPVPIRLADVTGRTDANRHVGHVAAFRLDATTAVAALDPNTDVHGMLGEAGTMQPAAVLGFDPVRLLAAVQVPEGRPTAVRPIALASLQTPTYVFAVEGTRAGVTIRPVFLGRSERFDSPRWTRPLLPLGGAVVTPGALVFTLDGDFVGCVVTDAGTTAIASATDVLDAVSGAGLAAAGPLEPGLAVQPLTPRLAVATGATSGVVVAEVDPAGAAAALEPGDVIVEIDGERVHDPQSVMLRLGRQLAAGPVMLTVIRDREPRPLTLRTGETAAKVDTPAGAPWTLELVRGVGTRVVSVQDGSAFASAGLRPEDVMVRFGQTSAPTPAQVAAVLAETQAGRAAVVVVDRGNRRFVTAVVGEGAADGPGR